MQRLRDYMMLCIDNAQHDIVICRTNSSPWPYGSMAICTDLLVELGTILAGEGHCKYGIYESCLHLRQVVWVVYPIVFLFLNRFRFNYLACIYI
jgi:hypothetical protein